MSAEQMPLAGTDTGTNQTTPDLRVVEKLNCKGLHLPVVTLSRAKALLPSVAADPELNWDGGLSVAYVLRWACKLGLDALERRYQPAPTCDEPGGFDEEAIRRIVREELALAKQATDQTAEEVRSQICWESDLDEPLTVPMPRCPRYQGGATTPDDGEAPS